MDILEGAEPAAGFLSLIGGGAASSESLSVIWRSSRGSYRSKVKV